MGLFASIVRKNDGGKSKLTQTGLKMTGIDYNDPNINHIESDLKKKYILLKSQECIQRMEIASLTRFALLNKSKNNKENLSNLVFFTPCEELDGGSVFSRMSS